MKKTHLRQLNLKIFIRTQELNKMKNNSLKFTQLHNMTFENYFITQFRQ